MYDLLCNGITKGITVKFMSMLIVVILFSQSTYADNKTPASQVNQLINTQNKNPLFMSRYTSLRNEDCMKVSRKTWIQLGYDNALSCPTLGGWRLYKIYDAERSLIAIARHDAIWTINDIIDDERNNFGHSPNIYAQRVEWRIGKSGVPFAVIVRVVAQHVENARVGVSRLFVFSLRDQVPSFCGVAKTNQEAKDLADSGTYCSKRLRALRYSN